MCGRGVATMSGETLAKMFRTEIIDEGLPDPSWNIKPTQTIAIVAGTPEGRRVTPARWSLVPPWADDLKLAYPTFNARIETAATKPTFKSSVKSKRCIIPFDGYYEWSMVNDVKTPFYIHPSDELPLSLAGLYSWWRRNEEGPWHLTATILTAEATGELRSIHDRIPVQVAPELVDDWLDPAIPGDEELLRAVYNAGVQLLPGMRIDKVAPLRGDGPQLIEPV